MTDYDFIRQLLKTIAEEKTFCVEVLSLKEKLAQAFPDMDTGDFDNEFYKALFLLKDCGVVEKLAEAHFSHEELNDNELCYSLGFGIWVDEGEYLIPSECYIRLTATGYGFYDNLCKNGFLAKVKKLSLAAAVEFSKAFITKSVELLL